MKKLTATILAITVLISVLSFNISAENYGNINKTEKTISEVTEYFEDGSSITTTITQQISNIETRATTKTITGSKTKTIKDSGGDILYKFKVTGTFNVTIGVSSVCTAVSCSASDCNYGWELDSSTTSKSGNTANAVGTFIKKTLFITTQTVQTSISLSCDVNGTLS